MAARALGPLTTGIGYLGAPVVGVISGVLILGEIVTPLDLAGIAVTTAGIVVVLVAQGRGRVPAAGGTSGAGGRRAPGGRRVPGGVVGRRGVIGCQGDVECCTIATIGRG